MKILLVDIETAPILGYTWGTYQSDVLHTVRDWYMLSISYKWLHSSDVTTRILPDYTAQYSDNPHSDYHLAQEIGQVLDEADVVVAHNGDEFDIKRINVRLLYHSLPLPAPFKTVDTLKVARRVFSFSSNRLNALAEYLGIGAKVETGGIKLWLRCLTGDAEAWKLMRNYNTHDVVLLEKVYLRLLPWIPNHPNHANYTGGCPKCGVDGQMKPRGFVYNKTTKYQQFKCGACMGWSRARVSQRNNKPEYVGV